MEFDENQIEAVKKMHNGCILCGNVGSGKSRTALAYYVLSMGGSFSANGRGKYRPMSEKRRLYIITTAKKRDDGEWLNECSPFSIEDVVIDSWNNIKKYSNVYGAFFIFDEQRLVGSGVWVKAFFKIAKKNKWILLTATPGDTWKDYIPVFVANGFYRNKTEFLSIHAIYSRYAKYQKIEYVGIDTLEKHRAAVLVSLADNRKTVEHHKTIKVSWDKGKYMVVWRRRWDPYDDEPIAEPGKLFYLMRKVVNSDPSRIEALKDILRLHPKVILFYSFDYELEAVKGLCGDIDRPYAEWNGHVHEEIPKTDSWVYIVNYVAGAEGWNCIETDTMVFYSQTYSYKTLFQAAGRINRRNTPFVDLWYYHLRSNAPIDIAILRALREKEAFNESKFLGKAAKQ